MQAYAVFCAKVARPIPPRGSVMVSGRGELTPTSGYSELDTLSAERSEVEWEGRAISAIQRSVNFAITFAQTRCALRQYARVKEKEDRDAGFGDLRCKELGVKCGILVQTDLVQ